MPDTDPLAALREQIERLPIHTRRNGWATPRLWVDRRDVLRLIDRAAAGVTLAPTPPDLAAALERAGFRPDRWEYSIATGWTIRHSRSFTDAAHDLRAAGVTLAPTPPDALRKAALAFIDHVAEAAAWPTPGIGCDGECDKGRALRAALTPKEPA